MYKVLLFLNRFLRSLKGLNIINDTYVYILLILLRDFSEEGYKIYKSR